MQLTNTVLATGIALDGKAIRAERDKAPTDAEFAAWMKTELTRLLQQADFTVQEATAFDVLEVSSTTPKATYAVALVTENGGTPITELLDARVATLVALQGEYTARYVAGVAWSEDEVGLIREYDADLDHDSYCSLSTAAGIATISVKAPV
ncbi:MAG: hypothetical protein ACM3XM_00980 [Mycobacterium leprae]